MCYTQKHIHAHIHSQSHTYRYTHTNKQVLTGTAHSTGDNNGFLACSEDEFVAHTRGLFAASDQQHADMRASGLKTAARFDVETFKNKFITSIFRGFLGLPVRRYIHQILPAVQGLALASAEPTKQVGLGGIFCS
jgi:hypothetical protein